MALDNALGGVDPEHPGSHWPVKFEVLAPYVTPGIEKSDRIAGTIYGCDIGPFVPVAKDTGVGKIANT